jgi:hypothetical protein
MNVAKSKAPDPKLEVLGAKCEMSVAMLIVPGPNHEERNARRSRLPDAKNLSHGDEHLNRHRPPPFLPCVVMRARKHFALRIWHFAF